jgi:hypothetical protein
MIVMPPKPYARIVVNVGPIDAAIGRAWQIGDRDKSGLF